MPIRDAVRMAIVWIVSAGLTQPTVGGADPSQIQRLGMSHAGMRGAVHQGRILIGQQLQVVEDDDAGDGTLNLRDADGAGGVRAKDVIRR